VGGGRGGREKPKINSGQKNKKRTMKCGGGGEGTGKPL